MLSADRGTSVLHAHEDLGLALVRVYLGLGLFAKGVYFVGHAEGLRDLTLVHDTPFASMALAHYIALAHLAGGALLALGLLTRLAALVQVPILLGAVFYVHWTDGLFAGGQGLEFAGLVLALLLVYTAFGGGRYSVDHHVFDLAKLSRAERETTVWPS